LPQPGGCAAQVVQWRTSGGTHIEWASADLTDTLPTGQTLGRRRKNADVAHEKV